MVLKIAQCVDFQPSYALTRYNKFLRVVVVTMSAWNTLYMAFVPIDAGSCGIKLYTIPPLIFTDWFRGKVVGLWY